MTTDKVENILDAIKNDDFPTLFREAVGFDGNLTSEQRQLLLSARNNAPFPIDDSNSEDASVLFNLGFLEKWQNDGKESISLTFEGSMFSVFVQVFENARRNCNDSR